MDFSAHGPIIYVLYYEILIREFATLSLALGTLPKIAFFGIVLYKVTLLPGYKQL